MKFWHKTGATLETIKWEHSIFGLPFALTGATLAAGGFPRLSQLCQIVVCRVTARSAGMSFNSIGSIFVEDVNLSVTRGYEHPPAVARFQSTLVGRV